MSSRIRYPSNKIKLSSSNRSLKFILIISLISVIAVVIVVLKNFFSPYIADSEKVEEEIKRETNVGPLTPTSCW